MKQFALLAIGLLAAQSGFCSLILQSFTQSSGTGLGTEPTILTIQGSGNAISETGCVGDTSTAIGTYVGSNGLCTTGTNDVKTGAGQIGPQTLAAGGVTSAANFAIVFNADQNGAGPITLTGLTAVIYSATTGQPIFQSGTVNCGTVANPVNPCNFADTASGMGKSGYVFVLDSNQQAAATAAGAFNNLNNVVGLSASASNISGGAETFYLATAAGVSTAASPVPEPSVWFMTLAGLGLVGIARYRTAGNRK